jgi:glycine oxidase
LAEAPVARFWSGLRPTTEDRLPLLGPTAIAGLHLACGHHRNGILLAPLTAEILAACVAGAAPPVELAPFSPSR